VSREVITARSSILLGTRLGRIDTRRLAQTELRHTGARSSIVLELVRGYSSVMPPNAALPQIAERTLGWRGGGLRHRDPTQVFE
jgi:hypothetical protein